MFMQEDRDNGREQLPPARQKMGNQRATEGKAERMSSSSDTWFFIASHVILQVSPGLITSGKITYRRRTKNTKTLTRNPPKLRHLGYK